MDKAEYIKRIDSEILPSIREQLIAAYEKGFEDAQTKSIKEYLKEHRLDESNIVDFGFGTKWIYKWGSMRFEDAKKTGLQFPTKEQILELTRCQVFVDEGPWYKPMYMRGPDGTKIQIGAHDISFCLWTDDSCIDEDYYIIGNVIRENKFQFDFDTKVYAGESFCTIFVLPNHLQE